jgi:hypothetical protein
MDTVEAQGRGLLKRGETGPVALLNSGSQHPLEVANSKNGIVVSFHLIKSFIFNVKDSILSSSHGNRTATPSGSYRCARVLCLSPDY